ncbi:hypothetical protein N431DRAFT_6539 [Stipitochalara longipes BDJ]|nr:hypothetical protein N431DRAFT_6539 [Stipitochalara longipes BDJ]
MQVPGPNASPGEICAAPRRSLIAHHWWNVRVRLRNQRQEWVIKIAPTTPAALFYRKAHDQETCGIDRGKILSLLKGWDAQESQDGALLGEEIVDKRSHCNIGVQGFSRRAGQFTRFAVSNEILSWRSARIGEERLGPTMSIENFGNGSCPRHAFIYLYSLPTQTLQLAVGGSAKHMVAYFLHMKATSGLRSSTSFERPFRDLKQQNSVRASRCWQPSRPSRASTGDLQSEKSVAAQSQENTTQSHTSSHQNTNIVILSSLFRVIGCKANLWNPLH